MSWVKNIIKKIMNWRKNRVEGEVEQTISTEKYMRPRKRGFSPQRRSKKGLTPGAFGKPQNGRQDAR